MAKIRNGTGSAKRAVADAALDDLIGDAKGPAEFSALVRQLQKRLAERMLAGELTEYLVMRRARRRPTSRGITVMGTSATTVLTESGAAPLDIPRDREGTFTPQLVPKRVRRLPQFDEECALTLRARRVGA